MSKPEVKGKISSRNFTSIGIYSPEYVLVLTFNYTIIPLSLYHCRGPLFGLYINYMRVFSPPSLSLISELAGREFYGHLLLANLQQNPVFLIKCLFIYFGYTGSWLWHTGSLVVAYELLVEECGV